MIPANRPWRSFDPVCRWSSHRENSVPFTWDSRQALARNESEPIPPPPVSPGCPVMTSSADDFAVSIASETSLGREIQERIIGVLEARSYSDHALFGVRLALEEALGNAIKHGNGMDPDKQVHIECCFDDDRVRIVIEDEGEQVIRAIHKGQGVYLIMYNPEYYPKPELPEVTA